MNRDEKKAFANEAEKALDHPLVTDVIEEFADNMGFELEGLPKYGIIKVAHYVASVARAQALGIDPNDLRHTSEEANAALLGRAERLEAKGVPTTVVVSHPHPAENCVDDECPLHPSDRADIWQYAHDLMHGLLRPRRSRDRWRRTGSSQGMTLHMSDPLCLEPANDDFYHAVCSCGWSVGPFPGVEEVVDSLMQHAYERGLGEPDVEAAARRSDA